MSSENNDELVESEMLHHKDWMDIVNQSVQTDTHPVYLGLELDPFAICLNNQLSLYTWAQLQMYNQAGDLDSLAISWECLSANVFPSTNLIP